MENLLGIQPYAFGPVYSEDEGVSDSEDSNLEGNSDSERVGKTDWCGCEVCASLRINVSVDCITQHMDFDITCRNRLATTSVN